MAQPKKLLDQVRDAIRTRHYSIRTEDAYVSWIKRFILYHGKKHPSDMGSKYPNAAKEWGFSTKAPAPSAAPWIDPYAPPSIDTAKIAEFPSTWITMGVMSQPARS